MNFRRDPQVTEVFGCTRLSLMASCGPVELLRVSPPYKPVFNLVRYGRDFEPRKQVLLIPPPPAKPVTDPFGHIEDTAELWIEHLGKLINLRILRRVITETTRAVDALLNPPAL